MYTSIQAGLRLASVVLALFACYKLARGKIKLGYLLLAVILLAISLIN